MKVTVERAQLLKSLGHVHRVVERRNTIPILGNVLVRAENAKLSLKATDLDLEVTETLAAETATAGSTTVPAHMFYDIVRKLPDGSQIVLEADGDRAVLAIRAGRSRFTLQTLPENDFPDLATGDLSHSFNLAAKDVKRLIDRTQFAISTEETRYYLNGIYLHAAGTATAATLRGVATDGHRLAQLDLVQPKGAEGMPGVIVPRKTVGEVQRLIEDNEAEVTIELSQSQDPLHHRQCGADLEIDRRHLPRLRPRHSARQRQGARGRQEGFRERGRPRLDDLERARPRGEIVAVAGQAGAVGDQSGLRQRHRRDRGRIRLRRARYRLQLALFARHRRPDRRRRRHAEARRPRLADPGAGPRRQERAVCADADAGVRGYRPLHALTTSVMAGHSRPKSGAANARP
ncbi:hypothetical protein ACVWYH_003834 [Bradyrhizobium sp. GM24.11]